MIRALLVLLNISGVAYDSSLSAYRVLGCTGSVIDDSKSLYLAHTYLQFTFFYLVVVEALCTDGQDILTLSLGGADG